MKSSKIDRLIKRIDPDLIDDDLLKWFKLFGNSAQGLSDGNQLLVHQSLLKNSNISSKAKIDDSIEVTMNTDNVEVTMKTDNTNTNTDSTDNTNSNNDSTNNNNSNNDSTDNTNSNIEIMQIEELDPNTNDSTVQTIDSNPPPPTTTTTTTDTITNKDAVVEAILKLILDDDLSFPKWIGNNFNNYRLNGNKIISPPEDMIYTLKHISMPIVLNDYFDFQKSLTNHHMDSNDTNGNDTTDDDHDKVEDMKDEFNQSITTKVNRNTNSTTSNTFDMGWDVNSVIMRNDDDDEHSESLVDNFFSKIDQSKESTISLCKLADLNYRLNRSKKNSDDRITHQLLIESKRCNDYTNDFANRKDHMKKYVDNNDETEVCTFVRQLKVGLKKVYEELPKFIDKADQYKFLLDGIKGANDILGTTIDTIRSYYATILSQRESLLEICTVRHDAERYNFLTSEKRLELYNKLEQYIDDIYNVIMKNHIERAICIIIDAIIKNKVTDSKSFTSINSCLEAIRLWKSCTGNNVEFVSKLLTIEKAIQKELESLETFVDVNINDSIEKADSATIILSLDSKINDNNSSEYSNRLNGCLDVTISNPSNESDDVEFTRILALLNIDISHPPPWCLYLTHSAQYLSKLLDAVELSEKHNNAKVPLIFDGSISITFDDKISKIPKTLRTSDRNRDEKIPESISEFIDDNESSHVLQQLTQQYGDDTISRLIGSTIREEEEAETIGMKRKRHEANKAFEKKSRINEKKIFEVGYRVQTPYGIGTVLASTKNKYNSEVNTIEVKLKWGKGYFNPDSLIVTHTFRLLPLSYQIVRQVIVDANNSVGSASTDNKKIGNMIKTVKVNNQNKFLHNVAVLLMKKSVSQTNLAKALSVTPANVSSWMLGRDATGNAKVEACFKKWLYYYDVDKIVESHFGLDVDVDDDDDDKDDDNEDDKKKNVKDVPVIESNDKRYFAPNCNENVSGLSFSSITDILHINADDVSMALRAAGTACKAVDIVMGNENTNVFSCTHPPGHNISRFGPTLPCNSTGFGLLNNVAIAATYARINWGIEKIAIVDIDATFGNGTAEIFKNDDRTFFASVHMIFGPSNEGIRLKKSHGFFPESLGVTEIRDNFVSIGVQPNKINKSKSSNQDIQNLSGPKGFRKALDTHIINKMEAFKPDLLIISAGFNGFHSDPIGGELGLDLDDYEYAATVLMDSMEKIQGAGKSKVLSILEGGYDLSDESKGLANCINSFVNALRL